MEFIREGKNKWRAYYDPFGRQASEIDFDWMWEMLGWEETNESES